MKEIDIDDLIENPASLPGQLSLLLTSNQSLISTIFSGSRTQELPGKILSEILKQLNEKHSEYVNNDRVKIMLTYSVYGGYYAFNENKNCSDKIIMDTLSEISGRMKF